MNCRPDILIVQDKSGSMNNDPTDNRCTVPGCTKWEHVTTAITNVLAATDGTVNWGIKYFPNDSTCDASLPPAVGIAPLNGAAVTASLATTTPVGNTPTRDAIVYGTQYLQSLTDTNPKFLLLATDGLPTCPGSCTSTSTAVCMMSDDSPGAEVAVMSAATQGIKTFVVGIGYLTTAVSTLNQLAIEGGEAQVGGATSYYAATDEAALEAALNSIVVTTAGCPH
jgi:hypothetical protein